RRATPSLIHLPNHHTAKPHLSSPRVFALLLSTYVFWSHRSSTPGLEPERARARRIEDSTMPRSPERRRRKRRRAAEGLTICSAGTAISTNSAIFAAISFHLTVSSPRLPRPRRIRVCRNPVCVPTGSTPCNYRGHFHPEGYYSGSPAFWSASDARDACPGGGSSSSSSSSEGEEEEEVVDPLKNAPEQVRRDYEAWERYMYSEEEEEE
ncbi:unnamed protein product, partial [Pylaiella littoralis]